MKRHKRGDMRADGLVFYQYQNIGEREYERWITPQRLAEIREQIKELNAKRRQKKQSYNAYNRAYYAANRDSIRARREEEKIRRADAYKEYARKWYTNNPEKCRLRCRARRASIANAVSPHHDRKIELALEHARRRISQCVSVPFDIDHIMPIKHGGLHHHGNLQLLPATLNRKKNARPNYELPDCYRRAA
jgi:outer membrane murein-binding lipoprotein Lpp